MNPNINLHIDSIVLDGLDGLVLASGQGQLLQQAVASQLMEMLTQSVGSSSLASPNGRDFHASPFIRLGQHSDATSFGPQLAHAIYANLPQSPLGSHATQGGQS